MLWVTLEIKELRKEYTDSSLCPNRPFKHLYPSQHYLYNGESGNQEVMDWEAGKNKMERRSIFLSSRMQIKFVGPFTEQFLDL